MKEFKETCYRNDQCSNGLICNTLEITNQTGKKKKFLFNKNNNYKNFYNQGFSPVFRVARFVHICVQIIEYTYRNVKKPGNSARSTDGNLKGLKSY